MKLKRFIMGSVCLLHTTILPAQKVINWGIKTGWNDEGQFSQWIGFDRLSTVPALQSGLFLAHNLYRLQGNVGLKTTRFKIKLWQVSMAIQYIYIPVSSSPSRPEQQANRQMINHDLSATLTGRFNLLGKMAKTCSPAKCWISYTGIYALAGPSYQWGLYRRVASSPERSPIQLTYGIGFKLKRRGAVETRFQYPGLNTYAVNVLYHFNN